MKTIYLLSVILLTSCFNLFGQYFIGQDKIDQVREQNLQSYRVKPADVKDKYVYLESIHTYNYISDIKIGFDKLEYKSTNEIVITLERGYKNKADSEGVAITGCGDYLLYLKRGEKNEITIVYKGSGKSVRLGFLLGPQLGPGSGESREYAIRFSNYSKQIMNDTVIGNKYIIKELRTDSSVKKHKTKVNKSNVKIRSISFNNSYSNHNNSYAEHLQSRNLNYFVYEMNK